MNCDKGQPGAKGPRSPQSTANDLWSIALVIGFYADERSTDDGDYLEVQDPDGNVVYSDWSSIDLIDADDILDWLLAYCKKNEDRLKHPF